MRYKCWRSNKDKELHLLCRERTEAFEALPTLVRHLGPWTGAKKGEVDRLRLPFRILLAEQCSLESHTQGRGTDVGWRLPRHWLTRDSHTYKPEPKSAVVRANPALEWGARFPDLEC